MASIDSEKLTDALCRRVRKEVGTALQAIVQDVAPLTAVIPDADLAAALMRILSELERAASQFVAGTSKKVDLQARLAFASPPALE